MIQATDFLIIDDDQYTRFMIGDRIYFGVPVDLDDTEKIRRLYDFINGYNSGFNKGYVQGITEQADKIRHALMLPSVATLNNF
ncbi:hypothetical protein [Chroococcus sp. FPU101]|uniref:hypothetical protein n=1 Tax=Chroococcus sp. FPU101 TaxID=1974212 RepID=UPI001A8FCD30|nr:hypothetical protein [Chroococcus sp. FPU101]GFE70041.1 hypothetical protein CFPU101_26510 [Chroococcus sp. FPU101]